MNLGFGFTKHTGTTWVTPSGKTLTQIGRGLSPKLLVNLIADTLLEGPASKWSIGQSSEGNKERGSGPKKDAARAITFIDKGGVFRDITSGLDTVTCFGCASDPANFDKGLGATWFGRVAYKDSNGNVYDWGPEFSFTMPTDTPPAPPTAITTTRLATKDAWYGSGSGCTDDLNHNGDFLRLRGGTVEADKKRSIVGFDISGLPSGAFCYSHTAKLRLTTQNAGTSRDAFVQKPNVDTWAEATVKCSNAPARYGQPGSPPPPADIPGQLFSIPNAADTQFDTGTLDATAAGGLATSYILYDKVPDDGVDAILYDKENAASDAAKPALVITSTPRCKEVARAYDVAVPLADDHAYDPLAVGQTVFLFVGPSSNNYTHAIESTVEDVGGLRAVFSGNAAGPLFSQKSGVPEFTSDERFFITDLRTLKYTNGAETVKVKLHAKTNHISIVFDHADQEVRIPLASSGALTSISDLWMWLAHDALGFGIQNPQGGGNTFGSGMWERPSSVLWDDGRPPWFAYGSLLSPALLEELAGRDLHVRSPYRRLLNRRAPHVNASDGKAYFTRPYFVSGIEATKPQVIAKSTGLHFVPLLDDLLSPLGSQGLPNVLADEDTIEITADGKTKTFLVLRKSTVSGNQHNCLVLQSEV